VARRSRDDLDHGHGALSGLGRQTNFDSQWISTQAKDAVNASGGGAFFNLLNPGQMLMWHIVLLPLVLVLLVAGHVVMVRVKGVVPPFEDDPVAPTRTANSESTGAP
jgi:quinol-cytochrome oxidoreductase complex cytochrome b subunit